MLPTPDMLPALDGPNAPHWAGARRGEVVVQRCDDCGTLRYPASPVCAHCGSAAHRWLPIGPTGRIVTWCRFHRPYFPGVQQQVPYTVLVVELDDGVRLFSNPAVERPDATPSIGVRVRAVFVPVSDTVTLIRFAECDAGDPSGRDEGAVEASSFTNPEETTK